MAELDEGGEQFPPWVQFRFRVSELERWFDGRKRILERGKDFPSDASFRNLKRRLEVAAYRREGSARVWSIDDDHVGVLLTPPWLLETSNREG